MLVIQPTLESKGKQASIKKRTFVGVRIRQ